MLGGMLVGVTMLHLSPMEYLADAALAGTAPRWIGLGGRAPGRWWRSPGVTTASGVRARPRWGSHHAGGRDGIALVVVVDAIATVLLHGIGL
jgi:hypothetical protein